MPTVENMWSFPKILLILVLMKSCTAAPATSGVPAVIDETDPELIGGYVEGDMIMNEGKNGWIDETLRWPNRIVYYYINSDFDQEHRNLILRGIKTLQANSCLLFKEATRDQPYYINVTSDGVGCSSEMGFRKGIQRLNLDKSQPGCFRPGTIMHEFLHALGFLHQQSTWNRDEYVHINVENIIEDTIPNFGKYSKDKVDNFGEEYDYGSIMHYKSDAFSKNGKPTIVPLIAGYEKLIGNRVALSMADIRKLNAMYKCYGKV